MARLAEHLVGRVDEVGRLEHALIELDQGVAGAVEVRGEPGIGKSRLLRELAARAEVHGHLVLAGAASELERDLPFAVFVDALDKYLAGLRPERLAMLDESVQAELGQIFPSLRALARGRGVALQHERHLSHRAVRELLERLAGASALVLVLDDVHWADSASVELLGALLRRLPGAPVLIAMGLRSRQAPESLLTILERARRDGVLERLELGPLGETEARSLLGHDLDPTAASTIYTESGGNPFYLQELARALGATTRAASAIAELSVAIEVPPAVAAALTEELGLLSIEARLVLEGAAVAGDPFEPDLAAAAAQRSEDAAMDAIDELLRLNLVRQTDVPRRFQFRHPLVRRAVYESTPAGWRLRAHERTAEALARRGAAAGVRAYHVERSAREGDIEAIAILSEAGESAARLAPASAARWLTAAIRLLPRSTPAEARIELLLARAKCYAATGQPAQSRADLLECLEIMPHEAVVWRIRVTTACAAVEHLLGLQKEAHRHLANALAELGGADTTDAVGLMVELGVDAFYVGNFRGMRDWAERAATAAAPLGDQALLATALAVGAWASALLGDIADAQAQCDEASKIVDELADLELTHRLDALAHLASADVYLDRFEAATRHAQRGLQIVRASGQGDVYSPLVATLGGSLWVQGRPREGIEVFDGAVEAARLSGNSQSLGWSLFNHSIAALAAGEIDLAVASARESVDLSRVAPTGALSALAAAVLGNALLESGQPQACVDCMLSGAGGAELSMIGGAWRARFLEVLTRALLATGDQAAAERAAAAAQSCADTVALPSAAAMAGVAKAELALHTGQPQAAAQTALAAADAFDAIAARWDAALARQLAGRALAAAGDADAGAHQLGLAAAAFDSFASTRYRNQAERELRKLGRHIHRRTRPGTGDGSALGSLTERELQVARLVVDRRTNAEIATELFLSQKTVETHLRNIFNKMGVETRGALARAVERGVSPAWAVSAASPCRGDRRREELR